MEVRAGMVFAALVGPPTALLIVHTYGPRPALRYLAGFVAATTAQEAFVRAMRRRIGPEQTSPADLLTLGRGMCGAILAGVVASGVRDRAGAAGWLGCLATLLGATALDWLDGPLARRHGATRLGAVVDIEADSWLTLWAATGAVRWGELPGWCLVPPLLHYLHPIRALLAGDLPAGAGAWWARAAGAAQMALFLAALAPFRQPPSRRALDRLACVVSISQGMAVLFTLGRDGDRATDKSSTRVAS
jgi:phosphatidylglycerophosphate synthase